MERSTNRIQYDNIDVCRILGLRQNSYQRAPRARDGQIVIYYGGWELRFLRTCLAGRRYMQQGQRSYDDMKWVAESGYYRLLLPVPGSRNKRWDEQISLLRTIDEVWQPAPVAVTTTALVVHLAETGEDVLQGNFCRCAEGLSDDYRVGVGSFDSERFAVGDGWDDYRDAILGLAVAQKC